MLPDGFKPLFRAAAALPASFDMPLFRLPVELPVVVPPTEEPEFVPVAAVPPAVVPPPVEPPVCANAQVPVNPSAVANANVASFMIAPSRVASGANGRGRLAFRLGQSQLVAGTRQPFARNRFSQLRYCEAGMVMAATPAMTSTRPSARLAGTDSPSNSTERPTPIGIRK